MRETTSGLKMTKIEEIWQRLASGGPGGVLRVDSVHAADLYGATDASGHLGLVLLSTTQPPSGPVLDAVEVTSTIRDDGRWAVGIWLREPDLEPVFSQLCTDLIESSRLVPAAAVPGFLLRRLVRWRELLERGGGPMSMSRLRGLVAELLVFEECLRLWAPSDVAAGWVGPLGGPQDFVLPGRRIEVKANFASARSVRISSIDQLDTDEPLSLVVVTLTTVAGGPGLAPADLVDRIGGNLAADGVEVSAMFGKRLDALGYVPDESYREPMFRLDGVQVYDVEGAFPRLRRADIGVGIGSVVYDILLGACTAHRTTKLHR